MVVWRVNVEIAVQQQEGARVKGGSKPCAAGANAACAALRVRCMRVACSGACCAFAMFNACHAPAKHGKKGMRQSEKKAMPAQQVLR